MKLSLEKKMEFNIAEADIGEITGNPEDLFRPTAGDKSIDFSIHYCKVKLTAPLHTENKRGEQILVAPPDVPVST